MSTTTMSQVAEAAGVSISTVSLVLSGRERSNGSISPETKQRVQAAVKQLGYRPNRSARALATGRSHLIGLCVRNLGLAHYANVIQRTEDEIRLSPFHLLVSRWDNNFEDEDARVLQGIFPWPLDGVLALEASEVLSEHWRKFNSWPAPIVNMGGTDYQVENLDFVGVDLPLGMSQAVKHLLDIGCKRIAFVSNPPEHNVLEIRARTYEALMTEHRRKPQYIMLTRQTRVASRQIFKNYIAEHGCPDGILCINDEVAIGIYRALCDLGIKVPQQVALIGCDGIEDTEYLECPISTIVQPIEEMCRLGWQILQQRIENPRLEIQNQVLTPQLAIRDSSRYFGGNAK